MENIEVWKGVSAFIETDYVWKNFIVEGVAILPKLVKQLNHAEDIYPLFLIDNDENSIRQGIYTRGLWGNANTYSDSVKEKEVEWVMLFNNYIMEECKKCGYKCTMIGDREKTYEKILHELVKWFGKVN